MAVPQSATVPTERLVAMSSVPVSGVGDTVLPRVMPLKAARAAEENGPSASLTKVSRREQAQAFRASDVAANGVPQAALRAYRTAEATMAIAAPSCKLSWALLAGIGRVESDHGRYAGAVLGSDGISAPEILGLPLNGVGPVAAIADTDGGSLDGDKVWDRAVGPMQFIPSTWAMVGVDGDGDGNRNPHDLDDAALAAAAYLCVGGNDLSTTAGMQQAVYSYNHSAEYVTLVLELAEAYQKGLVDLPALAASPMSGLASGPGVDFGLSEGRGVPVGGSDDTAAEGQADEDGNTKASGDNDARPNRRNDDDRGNQPSGGNDSTPPRGGSDGGNGTGNRTDNSDGGGKDGNRPGHDGGTSGGGGTTGGDSGGGDGADDADKPASQPRPKPQPQPEPETPNSPKRPEPTKPEPTKPEPTKPEPTKPEPTKPEPTKPEPTKPEPTKPEPTKPEPTKPEPTKPEPTEPEPTTDLPDTGTLDYCEGSTETLCYIASTKVAYLLDENPADYADEIKQGTSVSVTYDLAADGTWENVELAD